MLNLSMMGPFLAETKQISTVRCGEQRASEISRECAYLSSSESQPNLRNYPRIADPTLRAWERERQMQHARDVGAYKNYYGGRGLTNRESVFGSHLALAQPGLGLRKKSEREDGMATGTE